MEWGKFPECLEAQIVNSDLRFMSDFKFLDFFKKIGSGLNTITARNIGEVLHMAKIL